jgi:hypothetical protein
LYSVTTEEQFSTAQENLIENSMNSEPVAFAKEAQHEHCNQDQNPPEDKVAVAVVEFGQIFKIGTVDSGDKCKGDEYRRENGQNPHDVIEAIVDPGIVDIQII